MQIEHHQEAERWLRQAKEDLKYAKILLKEKGYYLVCFLSQQIAEKALKAYIYSRGEDLVIGHSVKELLLWAGKFDKNFLNLRDKLGILDSYYVPTRYPNGLPHGIPADVYNLKAAQESLDYAEEAVELVAKKLVQRKLNQ